MAGALDRFQVANRVFADALEIPSSQRDSFVERACLNDPDLRDSVLKLLDYFAGNGDFLENPAGGHSAQAIELKEGDFATGRFRVVRWLGRGGMGEVYHAEDLVLGDPVALKTIRAQWRDDPAALARFRDEVRLARRVSHPNVCRTFDVFSVPFHGEELNFFTMELLQGPSLAEVLAATPVLDHARMLHIACGIATGLDAAHRAGIVHGDLKPANIMLVPEPHAGERAVITDFGLSLVHEGSAGSSHAGAPAGSPHYMAPEQFLGEGITPAADIFAFAVILYEIISGGRPYPAENLILTAIRRNTQDALPLLQVAPHSPDAWSEALSRALSRSPSQRPSTAGELLQKMVPPVKAPLLPRSPVRRRALLAAAISGTGMASFFGIRRLNSVALPATPVIMLTALTSSRPQDAKAVEIVLLKALAQSPHVRVLDDDRVAATWKRMGRSGSLPSELDARAAREIAMREGAQFVLFGSFDRIADEWKLHLSLELMGNDPARPRARFPWISDREEESLLATAGRAVTWMRRQAGESARDLSEHGLPPEALTTRSWPALLEFTAAEEVWRAQVPDAGSPPDRRAAAELHLKRALDLDPQFVVALARLADIQVSSDEIDAGLLNYRKASEILDRANLTDRESLRLRGLFALDTGQYNKAADVFSMWALEYPREGLPLFYQSGCVARLGNLSAALGLLDKAIECDPNRYSFILWRAIHLLDAGRVSEARRDCDTAARFNASDWTDIVRAALAFAVFDGSGVLSNLEHLKQAGSLPYRSQAYGLEACLRMEWEQFDHAEALLREGLEFDGQNLQPREASYTKYRLLSQLYLQRKRPADALACCEKVLATKPGTRITLETGALMARAGDLAGARRCVPAGLPSAPPERPPESLPGGAAPELMEWPLYWRRVLLLWGEIALCQGNASQAFRLIEAAPQSDTPQEWPAALVRSSLASGQNTTALQWIAALFDNPAAYWIAAEATGPGFMRFAVDVALQLRGLGSHAHRLQSFLSQHD